MLGRAVPSVEPAWRLVGIAWMITMMNMEVSRHQMPMRNFGGSSLLARSHPPKRRKMIGSSRREEWPMNIDAPAHPQRWRMVVSSSSDDDELAAPPSLRDGTPPPAVLARAETREMRRMWQAIATTPGDVRASSAAEAPEIIVTPPVVIAQVATVVPETAWMTPAAVVEEPSGLGGGPMGSRRGHRFRATQWESQL